MGSLPTNRSVQPIMTSSVSTAHLPSPFKERQLSRSPIESPPIAKKHLKFLDVGRFHVKTAQNPLSCILPYSDQKGNNKENRSILKKSSAFQAKAWKGIGKTNGTNNKRVNFQPNVVVFHFDREQGNHVRSESQSLNCDPGHDRKDAAATPSRLHSSDGGASTESTTVRKDRPLQKNSPRPLGVNGTPLPTRRPLPRLQAKTADESLSPSPSSFSPPPSSSPSGDAVEFAYVVNDDQTMSLKFSRQLGSGVTASDVIVKANTSGNKIRVMGAGVGAHSTTSNGNATTANHRRGQEISERFELPVRVDSYRILARVDSGGTLFVEAPILPTEFRLRPGVNQRK